MKDYYGTLPRTKICLRIIACVGVLLLGAACGAASGRLAVVSQSMRFSRTELRARAAQPVALDLDNSDAFAHSFDVDALGLHVALPAHQSASVVFTPTVPGVYDFYCGTPGHKAAGMVGRIIIDP